MVVEKEGENSWKEGCRCRDGGAVMNASQLEMSYNSPRWSAEILDCSMPMTFDTYSVCSFDCLYCFSFYQKSHFLNGYLTKKVRSVNPEKVKSLFRNVLNGNYDALNQTQKQFIPYITMRKIMQWGALSDPFDNFEKRFGISLELMKFFDEIDYPLSFSTKGAFFTEDERYMELIRKHKHNWHFKISIITTDEYKARLIERGVPSPSERFKAMKRLADLGIHVTLRMRPYILKMTDWRNLIDQAAEAGADSVTTEFFCMESRANQKTKARYRKMSEVLKYDVWEFYMKNSSQNGYKRLDVELKEPILKQVRAYAHAKGLRFNSSDAHGRHLQDSPNCCGVPPLWNSQIAHFGNAVLIAKEKGEVHFSDIRDTIEKLFGHFEWVKAANYNTGSNQKWAQFYDTSMAQWIRYVWNNPKLGISPSKMYAVLKPSGIDENDDVVYKYTGSKKR